MSRNVAYIDNLSKQKVYPALALFSREMTTPLEIEYGHEAKGTWSLLRMMNDYIMQPLLTASVSKGKKTSEAMIFSSPNDVRLKCFREISIWLQSDWCTHIAQLPENSREVEDDAMSSN